MAASSGPASSARSDPSSGEEGRESDRGTEWTGLTDNYVRVKTVSRTDLANRITPAKLTGQSGDLVFARAIVDEVSEPQS